MFDVTNLDFAMPLSSAMPSFGAEGPGRLDVPQPQGGPNGWCEGWWGIDWCRVGDEAVKGAVVGGATGATGGCIAGALATAGPGCGPGAVLPGAVGLGAGFVGAAVGSVYTQVTSPPAPPPR